MNSSANMRKNMKYTAIVLMALFVVSCKSGCKKNKWDVPVDKIENKIQIQRFEQDLFACKDTSDLKKLSVKYGDFYFIFTQGFMQFPAGKDSLSSAYMLDMIRHPRLRFLYDTVSTVFKDFSPYTDRLNDAMKHYKYYFPNDSFPQIITYISEFGPPGYYDDKYIGIGLDLYLGKDFQYYQAPELEFPQYKIDKLTREYLVCDAVVSLIRHKINSDINNPPALFVARAVDEGKVLFMLDVLCPDMQDSIKIKYSQKQLDWIKGAEKEMWVDFVNRKVLYSKDRVENSHYFNDGPFTSAPNVSQEAPPRVGAWLGWQIVRKYMETHPNATVQDLLNEKDALKIFKESGYRPK